MNFKKFMSAGLAAATGLTMAMAGSSAKANELLYTSVGVFPVTMTLTIEDTDTAGRYDLSLSTTDGFLDYLSFAYDFAGDPTLDLSSVSAYDTDGNLIVALDEFGDPLNPQPVPYPTVDICTNALNCGDDNNAAGINGSAGFLGDTGPAVPFDQFIRFGRQGSSGEYLSRVDFSITSTGVTGDLSDGNPFTRVAAVGQSALDANGVSLGAEDSFRSQFAFLCQEGDDECPISNRPPNEVPEIDGPVLIQVGFALGGLYLLLLGRRRREDELDMAQMA